MKIEKVEKSVEMFIQRNRILMDNLAFNNSKEFKYQQKIFRYCKERMGDTIKKGEIDEELRKICLEYPKEVKK